jgi:pimeloyl-ACP methyl ester carboxylesterase
MKHFTLLFQIIIISSNMVIHAKIINDSIPSGKNFDKANFRLWYPDDCKILSGIIVLMPGSNGDGRGLTDDIFWQTLAMKYNFALLGCYYTDYQHEDMDIETYASAKSGSGQALLDVISLFADKSGHTELTDSPLFLWGHSAGGQFNYEFVCWRPERVIGFVVNKGGFYYTGLASKQARNVPGIFFTGEKDLESRKDIVKGLFSMNRRVGALWAFAEEPGAGHEIGQTRKLTGIFFDEIVPLRINKNSSDKGNSIKLKSISSDSGFIGDFRYKSYCSFAEWQKSEFPGAWLPDSCFAKAWQAFLTNKPF